MRGIPRLQASRTGYLIGGLLFMVICFGFRAMTLTPAASPPRQSTPQFENPVMWEDIADLDIFRIGKTLYYSASNMYYSTGAPGIIARKW